MKPNDRSLIKNIEDYQRQGDQYDRLRSLVLGDEFQRALETLITREEDKERVVDVISEAIVERHQRDKSLSTALAPVVDSAIQTSIDENPKRIIDVIFPILGPAVRKAVSAALADMVQTLNNMLEQSLNMKSIIWRVQAAKTGIPYAQYLLLRTLKFRVEQVLLVHRETGMLLNHVAQQDVQVQDPELVSSMLTAITDFVADSFLQPASDTLEGITFGEFQLHIIVGPDVVLAVAVRGTFNEQSKHFLNETLEQIHSDYAFEIRSFNGDREPFNRTEPILQRCLLSQTVEAPAKKQHPVAALIFIALIIVFFIYRAFAEYGLHREYSRLLNALQQEPGYVLVSHERAGHQVRGVLLRDDQSLALSEVIQRMAIKNIDPVLTEQIVYFQQPSSDSDNLNARIEPLLSSFDQVNIENDNGILKIHGVISQDSLNKLLASSELHHQFQRIDVSNVHIMTTQELFNAQRTPDERYLALIDDIEREAFYFQPSSLALVDSSQRAVITVIEKLDELQQHQMEFGKPPVELLILGFADGDGSDIVNQRISLQRAQYVQELLIANGVSTAMVVTAGVGHVAESALSPQQQRRVSLNVLRNEAFRPDKDAL